MKFRFIVVDFVNYCFRMGFLDFSGIFGVIWWVMWIKKQKLEVFEEYLFV
jgi:hypothetical protein